MRNVVLLAHIGILSCCLSATAQLTVQIGTAPSSPTTLVNHTETWRYHKGTNEPPADWHSVPDASLDATWLSGPGGIGFADGDDGTILNDMRNNYFTVYIRRTFNLAEAVTANDHLQLRMDWDDGFIAYLDGVEVARSANVPGNVGDPHPHNTGTPTDHPANVDQPGSIALFDVHPAGNALAAGPHVLALQGINGTIDSSDLTLTADLLLTGASGGPLVDGLFALVDSTSVDLSGTNSYVGATHVIVNGLPADFNSGTGYWSKAQSLQPGFNRLFIAALDSAGNILGSITKDIVAQTNSTSVSGTLANDVTWSPNNGIIRLTGNVIVPAGRTLTINPGVVVLIPSGDSITATANGTILVAGSDEQPVRLLPADAAGFGFLRATGAGASLTIRHADMAGGHLDANTGGTFLVEDSELRETRGQLLAESSQGLQVTIRRCYIHDYDQIHLDFTPVTIEDCLLEDVYSDATDFEGSNFDAIVRRNTYRRGFGSNTDAFDNGDCIGIVIEDCLIRDFPDKAISIADGSDFTVARNNLIYNCGSGISAYASSNLVLVGNTVFNCEFGMHLWNRPGHAGPAQGSATNNILWANTNSLLIVDGSVLTTNVFSDVDGAGVPIGQGNINADPLFVDPAHGDFHLQAGSPARGTGFNGSDMGVDFPVGGIPAAPLDLAAFRQTSTSTRLTWKDDAENEDGFIIARSTDGLVWTSLGQVGAGVTQYVDASAGQYYYRVRATNSSGFSPNSNIAKLLANETDVGGTLTQNTTWSPAMGAIQVRSTVLVPAGITLTIEAGTLVRLTNGVSISAAGGIINITGSANQLVILEPWIQGQQWTQLSAGGNGSSLSIHFADISGGHVEFGTNTVGLIEDSHIHNYYQGTTPIIHSSRSTSVTLRRSHMAYYHETLFQITPMLVEDCLFEYATDDSSDAIDFDSAPPGSTIRRCTFRHGIQTNTDAIDIGPTAGISSVGVIIEDCLMYNFTDKGVSIGENSYNITVRNCLIYDVARGVQVKDVSSAAVYNCTIADSVTGLHGFEKFAGTGAGRLTNTYNNVLARDMDAILVGATTELVVNFTDTQGSTWPGIGNINADPLFLDPLARDYRLAPNSACRGTGTNGTHMGVTLPVGGLPRIPESLSVTALSETQVHLAWSDVSTNEAGFLIDYSTDGVSWTVLGSSGPNTSMATISGSFAATQAHYFRIRGTNFIGETLNSNVATSSGDPNDIDGDGLPNTWETDHGLNPADPSDAAQDADHDGASNLDEYLAGTDPQSSASRFAVERIRRVAANQVEIEFTALAGKAYEIQYRANLSTDTWHFLLDVPAENFTRPFDYTDFLPPGTAGRYYRIKLVQ